MPGSWGVVVPVKRLALAKTRLSPYGDEARAALALAFAADVVEQALSCPEVGDVLVVTDDPIAAGVLAGLGARIEPDDPGAGLNPALQHGVDRLRSSGAGRGVATVAADLPAARPGDLAAVLCAVQPGQRAFVTDSGRVGTTLLAAGPGADLHPAYGFGSRAQHLASGATELLAADGLRRDVDTPGDLAIALRLGVGRHTAAAVALLSWAP